MARVDTLGNFLTDVAEAIRTKEGTTETIPASEFDTRISNLSGGEDLTEELNTYNTELEEQNVTLDDIVSALKNKCAGDGNGGTQPYVVSGYMGSCTCLRENVGEKVNMQVRPCSYVDGTLLPSKILLFGFARSDYTLTKDNLTEGITMIAEKVCPEVDGITQKLFAAYYDYDGTPIGEFLNFAITQVDTTARLALGCVVLANSGVPIVIDDVDGTGTEIANIDITTDNNLNIYLFSQIYGATQYGINFSEWNVGERIGCFISNYASDDKQIKNVYNNLSYNTVIHLQCPFERVVNNE